MIKFEYFEEKDFDLLINWINSPELLVKWAGTDFNYPLDEEQLKERIINRRVHVESGRVYNLISNPPKQEGLDDITKTPLTHREDDKIEFIEVIVKDPIVYREVFISNYKNSIWQPPKIFS